MGLKEKKGGAEQIRQPFVLLFSPGMPPLFISSCLVQPSAAAAHVRLPSFLELEQKLRAGLPTVQLRDGHTVQPFQQDLGAAAAAP